MRYERSLVIEQRLGAVLRLVQTGQYSTPLLADELQVSIPTVSRCIEALRERGHDIVAENQNGTWRYVLRERMPSDRIPRQCCQQNLLVLTDVLEK